MPATFPAHQGIVIPAKLRWPDRVDATALCVGAAAPDLAYPLGAWLNRQSHTAIGLLVWALPVTMVITTVIRRGAASGIFACLPDLGPLRLRSYRVLSTRRPGPMTTLGSAIVGSGSHVVIDGFTHAGRWGATWLGLNDVLLVAPLRGDLSGARALQYLGHVGGTVLFVLALLAIASSGHLGRWYGAEAVDRARAVSASRPVRLLFVSMVVGPTVLGVVGSGRSGVDAVFLGQTIGLVALLVAGVVVDAILASPRPSTHRVDPVSPGARPAPGRSRGPRSRRRGGSDGAHPGIGRPGSHG